jgi:hypothetical protein
MSMEAFNALLREIDPDMARGMPHSVELLLEEQELAARLSLSPDETEALTDIFILDVARYIGGPRRGLQQAILTLNGLSAPYADCSIGIDHRHYLVLTGYTKLANATSESYCNAFSTWVDQATELRIAAQAIGFEGAGITVAAMNDDRGEFQ